MAPLPGRRGHTLPGTGTSIAKALSRGRCGSVLRFVRQRTKGTMKKVQTVGKESRRMTVPVEAGCLSGAGFAPSRPPFRGHMSDVSYGAAPAPRVTLTRVFHP